MDMVDESVWSSHVHYLAPTTDTFLLWGIPSNRQQALIPAQKYYNYAVETQMRSR